MTLAYHHPTTNYNLPCSLVLTDRDRINIDLWVKIHDRDPYFQAMSPHRSHFSVSQDTALLTAAGFECGFSGATWFGRDRSGYLWRVSNRSEWSRNSQLDPLKPDRWEAPVGTIRLVDFYSWFTTNKRKG